MERNNSTIDKRINKLYYSHDKDASYIPKYLYKEVIKPYNNIIYKTKDLINNLNKKQIYSATVIFEYLLWHGYFSRSQSYIYDESKRYNFDGLYGLDVMKGTGVCLNNVGLHKDIMNALGYDAYVIGTFIDKKDDVSYTPDIRRVARLNDDNAMLSLIKNICARKYGNHVYTLINCDEACFILDPTNLHTFYFTGPSTVKNYFGKREISLKPESLLILEKIGRDKYKELVNKLNNGPQDYGMTKKEIYLYTKSLLEFCQKHKKEFEEFRNEIEDSVESINNSLNDYEKTKIKKKAS